MKRLTLVSCGICEGSYDAMREHCPYCGSRRAFIASHPYEPYNVLVRARRADDLSVEVVRAYQTALALSAQ